MAVLSAKNRVSRGELEARCVRQCVLCRENFVAREIRSIRGCLSRLDGFVVSRDKKLIDIEISIMLQSVSTSQTNLTILA